MSDEEAIKEELLKQERDARLQAYRLLDLLNDALEALDGIATEPSRPNDGYDHYKATRAVAKMTAKYIRSELSK